MEKLGFRVLKVSFIVNSMYISVQNILTISRTASSVTECRFYVHKDNIIYNSTSEGYCFAI